MSRGGWGAYKIGDILMELDNREQQAAIAIAEGEWKVAQSECDRVMSGVNPYRIAAAAHKVELLKEQSRYWLREHQRVSALVSQNFATRSEHDNHLTELKQKHIEVQQAESDLRHLQHYVREEDRSVATANVVLAKAKLDLARQHYDDTILRTPFDGSVLEILKREGEGSRPSDPEPAVIFGDVSRLRVRAEIDERFVAGLRVGQEAVVFGRGLGDRQAIRVGLP